LIIVLIIFLVLAIILLSMALTERIKQHKRSVKKLDQARDSHVARLASEMERANQLEIQLNEFRKRDTPKTHRRELEVELVSAKQKAAHLEEQITDLRVMEADPLITPGPEGQPVQTLNRSTP
jgi:hypothetical protein